ncbi:MAG: aldo/keto reductase [Deltaproteobacteria bacterium]|nr:aldo/keto reductase [Deltaproteobacteria bacterium]
MEYRTYGGTGMKVSYLCLGAMMFGPMGNPDHDECVRLTHAALDAGVNFIDTSDSYSDGESERILAKALKGRRDQVVLATKCFFPPGRAGLFTSAGKNVGDGGGSRRWIIRAIENSLRRLETDYIDVYQMHRRDWDADLEESLAAMTDLQRAGKIRVIGTSATPAEWIVEAQHLAERRALARVRSEQCIYSILNRKVEEAVLPSCQRYGVGTMVYAPLAGGWLTGKYRRDEPLPAGSRATGRMGRMGVWDAERSEVQHKYALIEELSTLAQEAGHSLTHMAMAFAAEHPAVSAVIMGPKTVAQLQDVLAGADLRLTPEVLNRIDAIVPPGLRIDPKDSYIPNPPLDDPARRRRSR